MRRLEDDQNSCRNVLVGDTENRKYNLHRVYTAAIPGKEGVVVDVNSLMYLVLVERLDICA